MNITETKDGIDTHSRNKRVNDGGVVFQVQVCRDNACSGLAKTHAQQRCDLLDRPFQQPRLVLARSARVIEVQWLQRVLRHLLHHVHHPLNGLQHQVLHVGIEHHRAREHHKRHEKCGQNSVQSHLFQHAVVVEPHLRVVDLAVDRRVSLLLRDGSLTQRVQLMARLEVRRAGLEWLHVQLDNVRFTHQGGVLLVEIVQRGLSASIIAINIEVMQGVYGERLGLVHHREVQNGYETEH
mmetsp:Transcript_9047/g.15299  ORF Transcript_9047/g.15299 Transcript_9047/m.15299 type:complete len:238 (+) Transcript_9047:1276-1989(+)